MSEFTKEDRERLVTVEVKLDNLAADFQSYITVAAGDTGYVRCAVHTEKIEKIESTQTTTKRTVLGAIVLIFVTLITTHWDAIMEIMLK